MKEICVLGKGDSDFDQLVRVTEQAATELGQPFTLKCVTDETEIMFFGVTLTPALVINDGVRVMGRVPDLDEVKRVIDMVE